jgi:hypothetical protein
VTQFHCRPAAQQSEPVAFAPPYLEAYPATLFSDSRLIIARIFERNGVVFLNSNRWHIRQAAHERQRRYLLIQNEPDGPGVRKILSR